MLGNRQGRTPPQSDVIDIAAAIARPLSFLRSRSAAYPARAPRPTMAATIGGDHERTRSSAVPGRARLRARRRSPRRYLHVDRWRRTGEHQQPDASRRRARNQRIAREPQASAPGPALGRCAAARRAGARRAAEATRVGSRPREAAAAPDCDLRGRASGPTDRSVPVLIGTRSDTELYAKLRLRSFVDRLRIRMVTLLRVPRERNRGASARFPPLLPRDASCRIPAAAAAAADATAADAAVAAGTLAWRHARTLIDHA